MSNLDIPAFLLLTQEDRKKAWQGVRLTVQGSGFYEKRRGFYEPRGEEEPATKKLRVQLERETKAKKAEGLERLKQWKEEHR